MSEESLSQNRYYRHSGQFSPGGALMALLLGLLVGVPMAWLYAWFIRWDPFIYFNFFACCLFGGLMGFFTQQFLASRKCRSATVTAVVAFLVALLSYYLSWAVWLHAVTGVRTLEFVRPITMLGFMLAVNEHGFWTYHGTVARGGILWAIWALEAGLILGNACYWATHEMLEATFCETCEIWTKEQTGVCTVAAGDAPPLTDKHGFKSYLKGLKQHAAELKMRLENKDLGYLAQLGPIAPGAIAWYRFDLHSCPLCNSTHTLRATQMRRKVEGKKVKKVTDDKEVLRQLLLSRSEAEALRKLKEKHDALDADDKGKADDGEK